MADNNGPEEMEFDQMPTEKEGYLYKQGKGDSALGSKGWKKRFFKMKGNHIAYYKGAELKGMIPINGAKVVPSFDKTRKNPFEIRHPDRRSYFLDADTKDEQLEWLKAIGEVAVTAKKYKLPMKKYREILNVDETATKEQVSKVYKRMALKNHPDKGGSVDKFKTICEAYEILIASFDEAEEKRYRKEHIYTTQVQKGPSGLGLGLMITMKQGGDVVVGKTLGLVEAAGVIQKGDKLIEIGGMDIRGKSFKEVQEIAVGLQVGTSTDFKFLRVVVDKNGEPIDDPPVNSGPKMPSKPPPIPTPSGGGKGGVDNMGTSGMVLFGDEMIFGASLDSPDEVSGSGVNMSAAGSGAHSRSASIGRRASKESPTSRGSKSSSIDKGRQSAWKMPGFSSSKKTPPPIPAAADSGKVSSPAPAPSSTRPLPSDPAVPAPAPAPQVQQPETVSNGSWQEDWERQSRSSEEEYQAALKSVAKHCPMSLNDGEALKLANAQLQLQLEEAQAAQVQAAKAYSADLQRLQSQIETLWTKGSAPDPNDEVSQLRAQLQNAWAASHTMANLQSATYAELQQCRSMGGHPSAAPAGGSSSSATPVASTGPSMSSGDDDSFVGGNPMMGGAPAAAVAGQSAYMNELKKHGSQGKRVVGQAKRSDLLGGGRSSKRIQK